MKPWQLLKRAVVTLHHRGYQQLRLHTSLSPGFTGWRFSLRDAGLSVPDGKYPEGSLTRVDQSLARLYDDHGYEWCHVERETPDAIADGLLVAYPELMKASHGQDEKYANWLSRVTEITSPDGTFVLDWDRSPEVQDDRDVLLLDCEGDREGIPKPPPPPPSGSLH